MQFDNEQEIKQAREDAREAINKAMKYATSKGLGELDTLFAISQAKKKYYNHGGKAMDAVWIEEVQRNREGGSNGHAH